MFHYSKTNKGLQFQGFIEKLVMICACTGHKLRCNLPAYTSVSIAEECALECPITDGQLMLLQAGTSRVSGILKISLTFNCLECPNKGMPIVS